MAMTPCPNLYLRHLPATYLETELQQLLEQHTREGAVCRLTVWKDHQTRMSKGFGMAEFESVEMASRAFKALRGAELITGKPLEIEYHHKKRKEDGSPDFGAPCTNLYVRGLPMTMTEEQLRDYLRQFGEIKRLTIWKDQWGHSKGFGMCEFGASDQARAALLNLRQLRTFDNQTPLHVEVNPPKPPKPGRQGNAQQFPFANPFANPPMPGVGVPSGMSQQQPPPQQQQQAQHAQQQQAQHAQQQQQQQGPIANLFIKSIPMNFEERDLQELVQPYGQVVRATVWRDRDTGSSKGFGLVEFANVSQATNALNALNGVTLEGSVAPLHVEYNYPRNKSNKAPAPAPQPGAAANCSNICLKSLPLNFTDMDLQQLLSQYGRIVRSTVWKDTQTNQSRGMAFCEFASPVSAAAAIQRLNGATLQGQTMPINVELHTKVHSQASPPQPPSYAIGMQNQKPMSNSFHRVNVPAGQPSVMPPTKAPAPLQQMQAGNSLFPYPQMGCPNVVFKGLPKQWSDPEFKALVEQHGQVQRVCVYETKGVKTGVAQCETVVSATAVMNAFQNVTLPGTSTPLQLEFHHATVPAPMHQISHSQRPFNP
eukprot:TRINITY_DN979_c0_g1_i1.p1 TRINITY_DN979_c0_g1~~TRINITY_DN979_c0_g1_i1.p1  ORF type:complete len:625 (+),score=172.76 TRINITY_DN979_c0_g1_i1:92-1876(+)